MVLSSSKIEHNTTIPKNLDELHVCVFMWLVIQSCPTLCDPMDCSPPGSSCSRDSSGKNTGVGCHFLLQGIFPTQGSNPGLPHWRQILYWLSHQGSLNFCINVKKKKNWSKEYVLCNSTYIKFKNRGLAWWLRQWRICLQCRPEFDQGPSNILILKDTYWELIWATLTQTSQ